MCGVTQSRYSHAGMMARTVRLPQAPWQPACAPPPRPAWGDDPPSVWLPEGLQGLLVQGAGALGVTLLEGLTQLAVKQVQLVDLHLRLGGVSGPGVREGVSRE